ncbi:DUF2859 domain-containing protein [Aliivibrio fischeri]|uniref:DUF2859 domain-containing protein n=1 Tax=Aliivibrio fischeri TaxID=668 RepID=UPI0007C4515C|nr:DUF2859 domain-containing protein [Aliivibrio fischeri]
MHKRSVQVYLVVLMSIFYPAITFANSYIVIGDRGGKPISTFIPADILEQTRQELIVKKVNELAAESKRMVELNQDPTYVRQQAINALFPLKTPGMAPISLMVDIIKPDDRIDVPMAFVGSNEQSVKWLDDNYQYLVSIKSPIILVEVDSPKTIQKLKSRYPKLVITPQYAVTYQVTYGLPGYPVLLTNTGIYQ